MAQKLCFCILTVATCMSHESKPAPTPMPFSTIQHHSALPRTLRWEESTGSIDFDVWRCVPFHQNIQNCNSFGCGSCLGFTWNHHSNELRSFRHIFRLYYLFFWVPMGLLWFVHRSMRTLGNIFASRFPNVLDCSSCQLHCAEYIQLWIRFKGHGHQLLGNPQPSLGAAWIWQRRRGSVPLHGPAQPTAAFLKRS